MSLYVLENHCLQTHREHQVQMVRRESLVNLEVWDCLERVFVNKRKDMNVYNIMLTNHMQGRPGNDGNPGLPGEPGSMGLPGKTVSTSNQ